ncbi:toll/interleukin-1 receptor domain-containing protein [Clostridium estertheticum]|uniref:TIR domain-containing protein n=1 Tax=Clostridium estertheticum TaxID=238834 RepID=UPI001C0DBEAE|nr:toll/interleukin-1 receptor domain-containing protein [Clostridium estertheticum]MBU3198166.1 toll/interleukin-1 receptor domain-containing protein [Clostridium estertheticum]WAG65956.1 toll/interleukin-1 receptor domain-containing protein [Clostridium estertheticum]
MEKDPTAFVSYSWDSKEHKRWVLSLVSKLFDKRVETSIDVLETQNATVNLNNMMIKNIREKDYTILVLTEEYAKKADELQGGVGFETNMLIPLIMDNLQKIIPIVRTKGDKSKVIPFYLTGVHYIDFSDDIQFEESFTELLYKIYKVDLIEKPKLGIRPNLKPRKIESNIIESTFDKENNGLIPNFLKINDIDKNKFMKLTYSDIINGLNSLMKKTKANNSNFDFDLDTITSKKTIAKMYLDGTQKYAFKVWLGSGFGGRQETINLSYGNFVSDADNSMNEIIACEVDKDNKLGLIMTMNIFGNRDIVNSKIVISEIWKNVVNNIS